MADYKIRFNKELGINQAFASGRWRKVEERTCAICGDKYWRITYWHDRGLTCGKQACIQRIRRNARFAKLRKSE